MAFMQAAGFMAIDYWTRDYGWVHRWARGRRSPQTGEIRDVIFARKEHRG
jgi:hypothetical protein